MRLSILVSVFAAQLAVGAVVRRQDADVDDNDEDGVMTILSVTPTASGDTASITTSVAPFGGEVSSIRPGQFGGEESTKVATNLTPSTTTSAAPVAVGTQGSEEIISCHRQFYEWRNGETPYQPFCRPRNRAIWKPDTVGFYYVTWNKDVYSNNETVTLTLNRHQKDLYEGKGDPAGVWESDPIPASKGFTTVKLPSSLLKWNGTTHDEAELYFIISSNGPDSRSNEGPNIVLSLKSTEDPVPPPKEDKVDKKAIAIGVPLAFVGVAAILLLLHCTMRRERRIGPIHIGGVRARRTDYASRKSQAERMRGAAPHQRLPSRAESADWELSPVKKDESNPFRDIPSPTEHPARFRDSSGHGGRF